MAWIMYNFGVCLCNACCKQLMETSITYEQFKSGKRTIRMKKCVLFHCCVNSGLSCPIAGENNKPTAMPGMEQHVTCVERKVTWKIDFCSLFVCVISRVCLRLQVVIGWDISGVCCAWIRETVTKCLLFAYQRDGWNPQR